MGDDSDHHTPLITQRLETGLMARLPPIDHHCAYVLAFGDGELKAYSRMPGFKDRNRSVRCYVVDTSTRPVRGTLQVPANREGYYFEASYDAQWRVADSAQVVRDNLHDGDGTVVAFLKSRLRPIGRQSDPDDSAGVETKIDATLGAPAETGGLPVGNGLALIALTVEVTPDPKVKERKVALDDDLHEGTRIERRTMRLRHLLDGDGSAILYHLAQNPTDTHTVLQMIVDSRDKSERLKLEWLDRMRADDAIQDADYDRARARVLGDESAAPPVLPPVPFGDWPHSTPQIIDAAPPAPPPGPAHEPLEPSDPTPESEPTTSGPAPPPPPLDVNPFAATAGSAWLTDQEPEAPSTSPRPEHAPKPATPAEPAPGTPRAPRDVRAERLASGKVFVQWRDVGDDVEYRVRRQLDDGRWHMVAHTTDPFVEDGEAPPGAVGVYAVSAEVGGLHSPEARSGR